MGDSDMSFQRKFERRQTAKLRRRVRRRARNTQRASEMQQGLFAHVAKVCRDEKREEAQANRREQWRYLR